MALDTVVLVDGDGRHRLVPEVIGGTDEIVLAAVTVSDAIDGGAVTLDRLCRRGRRAGGPGRAPWRSSRRRHDTVALLQDDAAPWRSRCTTAARPTP